MTIIAGATIAPKHFAWNVEGKVATITIDRPERKNPLTFESYAELRDTFRTLQHVDDIKTVVITGSGGNFCSGGDVHEIIGPLLDMNMKELLRFTEMTGDVVKAMRTCPQPIVGDGFPAEGGPRRRDPRHGVRPALRHREFEDRFPVHPGRARRLRHGRVLYPAAYHRPGPGLGTALYRPLDVR